MSEGNIVCLALIAGATVVAAGLWFGRSSLGLLNFLVLQWFGVRLARVVEMRPDPRDVIGPIILRLGWITSEQYEKHGMHTVPVGWRWLRWVWPLTGWWSDYRWIARRS